MNIRQLSPVTLFLSILLLLPFTWFNDLTMSQFTYSPEGYHGWQVFSFSYPIVFTYIFALLLLLYRKKNPQFKLASLLFILVFMFFLVLFPYFFGYPYHLTYIVIKTYSWMLLLVMGLAAGTIWLSRG